MASMTERGRRWESYGKINRHRAIHRISGKPIASRWEKWIREKWIKHKRRRKDPI